MHQEAHHQGQDTEQNSLTCLTSGRKRLEADSKCRRVWEFAATYYDVPAIEQPLLVRMPSESGLTCIAFS